MRPLIGISTCLDDRGRWRSGRSYLYCDRAYADAVADAGGLALHLPSPAQGADLPELARDAIARLDGLLLPGGDDFVPQGRSYPDSVRFDPVPAQQLAFDRALLRAALAAHKPIFGICYGMQLIALEHGSELHYDLGHDRPESEAHSLPEQDGRHEIVAARDAGFPHWLSAEAAPQSAPQVNSLHHQAIARLGAGLDAVAQAPDGVIEALERTLPGPFCVGVQWHPEKLTGAAERHPLEAFVEACRNARPA